MAKFSKKVMGKEVGSAAVYAEPHTMKGTAMSAKDAMLSVSRKPDPTRQVAGDFKPGEESPGEYEKVSNYFVQVKFPSGKMEGVGGGGGRKRRSKMGIKREKAPKRQNHNLLPCAAYN